MTAQDKHPRHRNLGVEPPGAPGVVVVRVRIWLTISDVATLRSEAQTAQVATSRQIATEFVSRLRSLRFGIERLARDVEVNRELGPLAAGSASASRALFDYVLEEALSQLGLVVGIDDDGTANAGLGYLRDFDARFLKIDRSLASNVLISAVDREIVASSIRLGHAIEMTVVAEGIEDVEVFECLRDLDCDFVQRYLVGRPAAAKDIRLNRRGWLPESIGAPPD